MRDTIVRVRCTQEERERWHEIAEKHDITMSDLLREGAELYRAINSVRRTDRPH